MSLGIAALIIVGSAVVPPLGAWSAAADVWLPEIADSATLKSPAIVTGTITDNSGVPFAAGTAVELVAFPSSDVTDRMAIGDSVQATPVAKALVRAGGIFAIRIGDISALARYASKSQSVDFEVRAISGGHYAAYSFSRTMMTHAGVVQLASATTANQPAGTVMDLRALAVQAKIVSLPPNPVVSRLGADSGVINKTDVCGESLVSSYGSRAVTVGSTYTTASGASAKFTYSAGATSTLGVGYSVSGTYGSFSGSGTSDRSSASTVDFGTRSGSYTYGTFFTYGKYAQWCYPVYNSGLKSTYAYKVHSNGYAGGSTVNVSSAPTATYCVALASGTSFSKSTTAAYTWSGGASLSSVIGVNLSSKTGYTSTAKLTYSAGSGNKHVCGTSGLPAQTPQRIVVKP
jgi:hypothetical protein